MSKQRDQLRQEAQQSRERIVAAVGELGDVATETKGDVLASAKRALPIVGGVIAALVLVRLGRRGW